jgi:hypothetical protein
MKCIIVTATGKFGYFLARPVLTKILNQNRTIIDH